VRLVETDAVAVQERLVMQVLADHHLGQGGEQRVVGGGPDRNPLIGEGGRGLGVHRVDDDHPRPGLLGPGQPVAGVGLEHRLGRVEAIEDDQFRMEQGVVAAGVLAAGDERGDVGQAGRAVGVVMLQVAAQQVHQPLGAVAAGDGPLVPGGVVDVDGVRAVLVEHAPEPVRHEVDGFVPADPDEAAGAALAHPLHGVEQPVRMVEPAVVGAPLQAGAQLRRLRGIRRVIGGQAQDPAVLDVRLDPAAAAAVVVARHRDDLRDRGRRGRRSGSHRLPLPIRECRAAGR
jgi:hypothetical protein